MLKTSELSEYTDKLRKDLQPILGDTEFSDTDNLVSLGLDSMKIMRMVNLWRKSGAKVTFTEMLASPRLTDWAAMLCKKSVKHEKAQAILKKNSGPFPLTDVQYAYWIGRREDQALGGVGCHAYVELDGAGVEPLRLESAWRNILAHHPMLRAVFHEDGTQEVLAESACAGLMVHHLENEPEEVVNEALEQTRNRLSHRVLAVEKGQVAGLELSLLPGGRSRLHFDLDLLVADVQSLNIILRDLAACYAGEELPKSSAAWYFDQYLQEDASLRGKETEVAAAWWKERLDDLPGAPGLPLKANPEEIIRPKYRRRNFCLGPSIWKQVKNIAAEHEVTPAMVLLSVYAEVLGRWSSTPRFFINLPLFNRDTGVTEVENVVADFTSLLLLPVDMSRKAAFAERVRAIRSLFLEYTAHSAYSGVKVQRDLARLRTDERFIAPVVFACNLGTPLVNEQCASELGELGWMISQTPQVWLDFQVYDQDGGLLLAWDSVEGLFPDGMLDEMFSSFTGLLCSLADPENWQETPELLTARQLDARKRDSALAREPKAALLHGAFFRQAVQFPSNVALIGVDGAWTTYAELAEEALKVAAMLRAAGAVSGDAVAVTLPRGVEQIIAVMGILASGCFYIPVSPSQPECRQKSIYQKAGVRFAISDAASIAAGACTAEIKLDAARRADFERPASLPAVAPDSLAYVIFTSGSTGEPKGVAIEHQSAWNTIRAINSRYGINAGDTALAVSSLDFDLSVYDIFGLLGAGGRLVLLPEEKRREPAHWENLALTHGVSVWNSVPVLLDMLLVQAESSGASLPFKTVMLSGDWIGLDIPARLKTAAPLSRLVAMGGATEASIWSNYLDVKTPLPAEWKSIPYGRPLDGQSYRVVDAQGRDCPDWVSGELLIGGAGVARKYIGDDVLSAERFFSGCGCRWYRTGDMGRFWPDGTIEFLGRKDFQVKVRGHRIELGEIEAALRLCPDVREAVVAAVPGPGGIKRLAAYLVPVNEKAAVNLNLENIKAFLTERLPEYMIPSACAVLEALPLNTNGKVDRKALPTVGLDEPRHTSERPLTPLQKRLAMTWASLLSVERPGLDDNFFESGGDSLLATRLATTVGKELGVKLPLDRIFSSPSIRGLADYLDEALAAESMRTQAIPDANNLPEVQEDPDSRYLPFPLTSVQHAYWIGRTGAYSLGNVSSHIFFEFDNDCMDLGRLEQAWNMLVRRHEMLRAVFQPEGTQRILETVPEYSFKIYDYRTIEQVESEERLLAVRDEMSTQLMQVETWPLFDIRAARYRGGNGDRIRLYMDFDSLIADAWSIFLLMDEWHTLYKNLDAALPEILLSFRDYVNAESKLKDCRQYSQDLEYWKNRLDSLPPPPELPLARQPAEIEEVRTQRRSAIIPAGKWKDIKKRLSREGLSPSGLLVAVYAEVLARWSKSQHFTLNLTLFNRLPMHIDVDRVVGDFTSLALLEVDNRKGGSFIERARNIQRQLWQDLNHRLVSGVDVLRELAAARKEPGMVMPVVFTGAVGLGASGRDGSSLANLGDMTFCLTQTPQIWLDYQAYEQDGALMLNWDAVEELFRPGVLDAMFAACTDLLERLAEGKAWTDATLVSVPDEQTQKRINGLAKPLSGKRLDTLFTEQAAINPQALAVITSKRSLTYAELDELSSGLASRLMQVGASRNSLCAILMEKGWEQTVAALGIIRSGAAYLPIDPALPAERINLLLKQGEVKIVLTQSTLGPWLGLLAENTVIEVDKLQTGEAEFIPPDALDSDLAYVIYTSGSTGLPKGVMIDHKGAVNTILDVNERFGVSGKDRIFGLSNLNFDLSVYDLFGAFAAGAAVVLPEPTALKEPGRWLQHLHEHKVSIWNSVPALMQMLVEHLGRNGGDERLPDSMRLVLMSGDWIPLELPATIGDFGSNIRVISMGGATESSIWSILYEVEKVEAGWRSIPYGKAMLNQSMHVFNDRLEPCPDWVTGGIYIGGPGLALGYWRDSTRTDERFVLHPRTGTRLYRTGDLGRFLPDGNIEFLGRDDFQVKVNGYRVELGEIEAALCGLAEIRDAIVVAAEDAVSLQKRLVAHVLVNSEITQEEIIKALSLKLPSYMLPALVTRLDRLPLSANGKVDRNAIQEMAEKILNQYRPQKHFQAPEGETERITAAHWRDVLGAREVGRQDNFFDIGGNSLLAVRLANRLKEELGKSVPVIAVFEYPTVAEMSAYLGGGMLDEGADLVKRRSRKSRRRSA